MKEFKARLIARIKRTPTVESFRFLPQEKIEFIPGQFTQLIFDENNRENKELNKYLSFSSPPDSEYVEVTKRLSNSAFSSRLRSLKINDEVLLKAPSGNCVFKDDYKHIGFLIGGIGITPVIAIIEYIINRKLGTDITLVYSNRTDEEIAFKQELDYWESLNKNLKIYYFVTDCQPKDKSCIYGAITKEEKHILVFQKILEKTEKYEPPKIYADEYLAYMNALAGEYIFTQKEQGELAAQKIKSDKESVETGIKFEKDSILFYEGMKKVVPDYDHKVLEELILQEQNHLKQLTDLKKEISLGQKGV